MSEQFARAPETERASLSREELSALLRDITEQRDRLLAQYEAMAFQVDESTRTVDDALIDARRSATRAEKEQHLAEEEAARIDELTAELEKQRRANAELAAEFARFRETMAHAPVEDPWGVLGRAASQIVSDWVAWARAKIPPDSRWLPLFDRTVDLVKQVGCLTLRWGKAIFNWAKPRAIEAFEWSKGEIARRSKGG